MSVLKQYHYLYKITNKINNKIYIGIHSTNNLDDGYFGSDKYLKSSVAKYKKENFIKEILEWFDWRCEALHRESQIVTSEFIKRSNNYNRSIGGNGGLIGSLNGSYGKSRSDETKKKISNSLKGNVVSEITRKNKV